MRLNKIAGRFSPPPSSSLLLLLQRVEINLLNYYTINPFFTAKDVIISFRACSCIIDYFILLSRCAEVQCFVFPTGVYAEVGFNGVHSAPECNCRHHLGAVSNTSHAYSNCKHFPCSIFFLFLAEDVYILSLLSSGSWQTMRKWFFFKPVINWNCISRAYKMIWNITSIPKNNENWITHMLTGL